jgi:hypothetical protein
MQSGEADRPHPEDFCRGCSVLKKFSSGLVGNYFTALFDRSGVINNRLQRAASHSFVQLVPLSFFLLI